MKVIQDNHPGQHHLDLELTPVLVYAPGFNDEFRFFTGLQLGEVTEQGMFQHWIQPIQVIIPMDSRLETCIFTMSMCGTVEQEQLDILNKNGHVVVNEDPFYRIELFL